MPNRRRSSCIGTYGRLLMKRRSCGAVHWVLGPPFECPFIGPFAVPLVVGPAGADIGGVEAGIGTWFPFPFPLPGTPSAWRTKAGLAAAAGCIPFVPAATGGTNPGVGATPLSCGTTGGCAVWGADGRGVGAVASAGLTPAARRGPSVAP